MSIVDGNNPRLPVVTFLIGVTTGAIATICLSSLLPDFGYTVKMALVDYFSSVQTSSDVRNSGEYLTNVRPSQIDRSGHMNNSMYLYELNFSRRQFFNEIGLWRLLKERNANMVIQAQTIRYRRELRVWQKYTIVSRIVQFSEKDSCFYLESRFVTPDAFVAAVHHVKYRVVGAKGANGKPTKVSPLALLVAAKVLPENYEGSMALDQPSAALPSSNNSHTGSSAGGDEGDLHFVGLWEAANAVSSRALNPAKKA